MPTKHINAKDVFPPELVKEIQKYYSNGYLWIPKRGKKNTPRKKAEKTEKSKRQNLVDLTQAPLLISI